MCITTLLNQIELLEDFECSDPIDDELLRGVIALLADKLDQEIGIEHGEYH